MPAKRLLPVPSAQSGTVGLTGTLIGMSTLPVGSSAAFFCTLFFLWGFFGAGMYPLVLGTLPAESVPAEIAGTAVSLPVSIGEILGAALMPTLAGMLSDKFNLFAPMWMASLCGIVVALLSFFYVESKFGFHLSMRPDA